MRDFTPMYAETDCFVFEPTFDSVYLGAIEKLNVQLSSINDEELKRIFKEAQIRMETMVLLHDDLFKTDGFSEVKLVNNLSVFYSTVADSYGLDNKVVLQAILDKVYLNIEQTMYCGLILIEVFTDVFEQVTLHHEEKDVLLILSENDGRVYISMTDNSCGIKSINATDTLRRKLILLFAEQLGGDVEFTKTETGKPTLL